MPLLAKDLLWTVARIILGPSANVQARCTPP